MKPVILYKSDITKIIFCPLQGPALRCGAAAPQLAAAYDAGAGAFWAAEASRATAGAGAGAGHDHVEAAIKVSTTIYFFPFICWQLIYKCPYMRRSRRYDSAMVKCVIRVYILR